MLYDYSFTTANISIPLNILIMMSRRHNIIVIRHGNPNDPKFTLHLSQHNTNHPVNHPVSVHSLQPTSPAQRVTDPKKIMHHYTNHITNIFNHDTYYHRTNFILHYIRGYTSSYTYCHHSMSHVTPTSSSISIYPNHYGISKFLSTPILNSSITQFLI
eukprot:bmy_12983T0